MMDAIFHSVQTTDKEHMVEYLHAFLKPCYEFSRKRLVKVVYMQAVCCTLVTGSEGPLNFCASLERTTSRRGPAVLFVHGLRYSNGGKRLLRGYY